MFQPGISGNTRGRPKGSLGGRAQALAALDRMLSKECNQQALFDALEKEFQADPARFFRNVVVPLIPRSTREALPPDANDDWLPMDRTPPSDPPPVLEPYVPPPPRTYPPPPVKQSLSGLPGLQPSVLRPQSSVFRLPSSGLSSLLRPLSSFLMSALRPPASVLNLPRPSSMLSFACLSLLLIPFALKIDPTPHLVRALVHAATDRLSRNVCAACVPVKCTVTCAPRPMHSRTLGLPLPFYSQPRVHSNAHTSHTLTAAPFDPCYSLLLNPPAPSPHTLTHSRTRAL